jgi:hypothetical protein
MHPRILGNLVVLAMAAAEVAANGRYGIGERARKQVKERLLFYRIDILAYQLTVDKTIKDPVTVLSDPADPSLIVLYFTVMTAEEALNFIIVIRQLLI